MKNNPYIEKVKNHEKILTDTDDIYSKAWKWNKFFKNDNPIVLEIWTWLGNFFSSEVLDNPDKNYVWIELRYKRLYKTAEKAAWNIKNNDCLQSTNFKKNIADNFIVLKDFWENVGKIFWSEELDLTYIFFPDPWDKNDRIKLRRLVQTNFLDDLYKVTKKWGKLIFRTDHAGYYEDVLKDIKKTSWKIKFKTNNYEKENLYTNNKVTEFEQIFRWQNIKICYIELEK